MPYNPMPRGPGPYRRVWDRKISYWVSVTIGSPEDVADIERRRSIRRVTYVFCGVAALVGAQLWAVTL